ncbi:hypothetical protein PTSG_08516 [Salpingoeca rosetta]|uniref:Vta1/callose synthase N-terminal domain-containing protein n=1 Tax=Salpingoeca rosetta (strain ATCC 50818 / BSB-021) TaxID=946362 RepID=F2UJW8_SALR5|nr:uncharacterized protein PTSG_08516 [Salpingoeca rosetta]EGD77417.1 hypothetical protein PTSG_08516 [Salpingoeca rosetta]|eukprot:XP_004990761.1 hypothetical protein PTSG_08516 [Salpingoeca rosetta]
MDVPDAAKDVKRFIKTGEALQAQAPYATFWCWMHALEVMVPRVQQDPSLQGFVIQLMDSVEQMKTQHGQLSSVSDKDTGRESVALLAAKIFQQADREDHAGATMGTALKFRTASTLFDVCKAMNPDIDEVGSINQESRAVCVRA